MSREYTVEKAADDAQWIREHARNAEGLNSKIHVLQEVIGNAENGICDCCCCSDDADAYEDIHAAQSNISLCRSLLSELQPG